MGRHFSGQLGGILKQHLAEIDVDLERDAWFTNALICHPVKGTVKADHAVYCRPNLKTTIEDLEPDVVVLMGLTAIRAFVGMTWKENPGEVERWAGWKIPNISPNTWVIPTYGLGFLLRMDNRMLNRMFVEHLKIAFETRGKPWQTSPDWKSRVEVHYDDKRVAKILRQMIARGGVCGVDYETNCLKPEYVGAEAVSFSVSWEGKKTISYPWRGEAIKATGELLAAESIHKVASNLKMEERWTRFLFGHGVRNWHHDTMIAAHVLDNRKGTKGLKFQAYAKLGMPPYNEHIEPFFQSHGGGHLNRIREVAMEDLLLYGGLDSLLEYQLAKVQRKELGL